MTEAAPVARSRGSGWKLALRIGVTVVLLAILVAKAPHPDDIFPDRSNHAFTLALLAGALVMTLIGVVLSAWRWQRVLLLFDTPVPLRSLTSTYLAGLFVGNVLPSTIGGDVVRVSRAANATGSTSVSFGSVVVERLTGFVALPLLVFAGFAVRPSLLDAEHAWISLLIAGASVVILGVLLFVAGHPRIAGRYEGHENWMRFIGAVHVGVDRMRREPRQIIPVLGTAILYQVSVVLTFELVFRALDIPLPVAGAFAFAPAVLMLQVLPLSLGGLGVREGALVLFLHSFLAANGISDSRAIAAGLLWYGCMLVVSMLGAPAFAIGSRKPAREPVEDKA